MLITVIWLHLYISPPLQGIENKKNSDKFTMEAHFLLLHTSLGR